MASSVDQVAAIPNVSLRSITGPDGAVFEYYVGTLRSDLVRALTFVPVFEESKKTYLNEDTVDGYQRPASAARMRQFGSYLEENPLSVVPPVVLSGRSRWRFKNGQLEVFGPAAVIDGQHRLGGFVWLYEAKNLTRPVDFVLLPSLDLAEERREFLAINNTQKGVQKSLTVFLGDTDEARVAAGLAESVESPFFERITIATKDKGHLFTLAAVARNVERTFAHGAFPVDLSVDAKIEITCAYWDIIADVFPEEWEDTTRRPQLFKLLETTGLIACSLAANDILGPAFDPTTKTVNWEMVRTRWTWVAEGGLDWLKDGTFAGLTGEVGGARIHKEIQRLLAEQEGHESR